jgi:SAM-dependent methyltransferase
VHGPSLTLSRLTVRRPVETALDVGTGGGIRAILAARHSGRVVATDVNARALNFAAFNTRLNGVDNVELRLGSFFEPVDGERLGLVTATAVRDLARVGILYRDSGLTGDTVSRDVVRITHAGKWLRYELGSGPRAYGAAFDRWLEYFRRLGIEGIASGALILRRRSGANWVRADELHGDRLGPAGKQIVRVFAAGDFLSAMTEERELLQDRLVLAPDALLEQQVVFRDREWTVEEIELTLQERLCFRAGLDQPTAALLTALDGKRTLGEVAEKVARLQGASRESVAQAALPVATQMLAAGFLERLV